jgi:hypothetical protein
MEVLLLLDLTVGGVDGEDSVDLPIRSSFSDYIVYLKLLMTHLEMEVLLLLGLAVGGVDGVDVVEDLVYIDLPVAQRVPALEEDR